MKHIKPHNQILKRNLEKTRKPTVHTVQSHLMCRYNYTPKSNRNPGAVSTISSRNTQSMDTSLVCRQSTHLCVYYIVVSARVTITVISSVTGVSAVNSVPFSNVNSAGTSVSFSFRIGKLFSPKALPASIANDSRT